MSKNSKTKSTEVDQISVIRDLANTSLTNQRFTSIVVNRAKQGLARYCAKMIAVTPSTLRFTNVKGGGAIVTVPLKNVVSIG